MNIIAILNSAPVGVILGIIITKTFDILNKRIEYKQEAKKIFYTKKLEVGEIAIQYLHTYYEHLYNLRGTITHALEDESMNEKFLRTMWDDSHEKLRKISNSSMDMFNKSFFYYNIDINHFRIGDANSKLYKNISDIMNLMEAKDKSNNRQVLNNYLSSIQNIMNEIEKVIKLILEESKKTN